VAIVRDQKASTSYLQRRLGVGQPALPTPERHGAEGVLSPPTNQGRREDLAGEAVIPAVAGHTLTNAFGGCVAPTLVRFVP
jgi:hypothetical protein